MALGASVSRRLLSSSWLNCGHWPKAAGHEGAGPPEPAQSGLLRVHVPARGTCICSLSRPPRWAFCPCPQNSSPRSQGGQAPPGSLAPKPQAWLAEGAGCSVHWAWAEEWLPRLRQDTCVRCSGQASRQPGPPPRWPKAGWEGGGWKGGTWCFGPSHGNRPRFPLFLATKLRLPSLPHRELEADKPPSRQLGNSLNKVLAFGVPGAGNTRSLDF
ncbi:hypothetical protein H1C71_001706 [Ictidomys tridecemlineatus]|nr:hypothetical protein H1C71_001706 [Ictidomys tridecemlineatus]KAG3265261.1 hypothetical protein H1C71_001706 [Ictidomys tridecemlineatus]